MRTITYGAACSLDGYIAGAHEELDWLKWTADVARLSHDYMSRVDTILMGRKTYEAGLRQGGGAQPGFEICLMGGGELAKSLFAGDLIDRVGVNIHPILLGSGIPLIPDMPQRINLRLLELERIAEDCVYAVYQVVRQ